MARVKSDKLIDGKTWNIDVIKICNDGSYEVSGSALAAAALVEIHRELLAIRRLLTRATKPKRKPKGK